MKLKNLLLFACLISAINAFGGSIMLSDTIPPLVEDEIYKDVDEVPLFSLGCNIENYTEKKVCSDKKMLEHIYMNVTYPYEARINGIEGTAVVSFIVEKNGTITNIAIVRNPGGGLGEDVVRVVESMPPNWQPAMKDGKPVRFQFYLPVKYRLETPEETEKYKKEQMEKQKEQKRNKKN